MDRDDILRTIRERMTAFAASRLPGDLAEDLAQEVMVVLHEKYPQVTALADLMPLSFRILRYKMQEARRKSVRRGEHRQVPLDDLPVIDPCDDPETGVARSRRVERLAAAMAQLGERCRELFRLKLEGRSFPEIQRLMGQTSLNTIYTWDFRCRKQLLRLMGGRWEDW